MKKVISLAFTLILIFFLNSHNTLGLFEDAEKTLVDVRMGINYQEQYDLVIIAPSDFTDYLDILVEHKNNHNLNTKLVTLDDIYNEKIFPISGADNSEKIKYFIKNALDNWNIKYVLFIGGRQPSIVSEKWLFPVRYSHIEDNVATLENRFMSDLYFADIYESDGSFSTWDTNKNGVYSEWLADKSADDTMELIPDVSIGRLPCRNKFEVQIIVNKIIEYENNVRDKQWFEKMVVVGGDTYTDNDYFEGEETNKDALGYMEDFEAVTLWASDGTLNGWQDIVNTINSGCGFIYFAGHGSPTTWATHPPFDDSTWIYGLQNIHMPLLSNEQKLPVCIVGGCHNSMFNISFFHATWTFGLPVFECWSWRLTRCINGGAIATIGCTGLGYGKEDKQGEIKAGGGDWLNTIFFREYNKSEKKILGDIWSESIKTYLDEFPIDFTEYAFNDTALDAKTVQEWTLIGDPSLKIGGY